MEWSGVEAAEKATGEEMATVEVKATGDMTITGEVIHVTTGEAKVQSVCKTLDGRIVASLLAI